MRAFGNFVIAAAYVASVEAFWRLPCGKPVVVERADPIVNPGAVSGHVHTIMGANSFNFTMDANHVNRATCTTCAVAEDKSIYWTPNLYFQEADGSFTSVEQVGGVLVYYLQRRDDGERVHAFPTGLRMLAGSPSARSFKGTLEARAITHACLSTNPANSGEFNGFPTANCENGLRTQVFFPSCWNGRDLDSPDHKSHMAYPDGMDNGRCPPTHPIRLVSIFYEIMWNINAFSGRWPGGNWPFVLSNGDKTGYSFHGDFLDGWNKDILQEAIDVCGDEINGVVEQCRPFTIIPDRERDNCFMTPAINEQVFGNMPELPGCNPVTTGPGDASMVAGCTKNDISLIGSRPSLGIDASPLGWSYIGCASDNIDGRRILNAYEFRNNQMTNELCIQTCEQRGYTYAGTEFSNECFCGNALAPELIDGGRCTQPCAGDNKQNCGNAGKLSVYRKGTHGEAVTNPGPGPNPSPRPQPQSQPQPEPKPQEPALGNDNAPPLSDPVTTSPAGRNPTPSQPSTGGYDYLGCAYDSTSQRTLKNHVIRDKGMTTEKCISSCSERGFAYAGTEFGCECFCSNSFDMSKLGADKCNMPCSGNTAQICGNGDRLSVYKKSEASTPAPERIENGASVVEPNPIAASIAENNEPLPGASIQNIPVAPPVIDELPTTTQPSISLANPSAVTASEASARLDTIHGFAYVGCAVDARLPRTLGGGAYLRNPRMTIGLCMDFCNSRGYSIAGLEWSIECFCANKIDESKLGAERCTRKCGGDENETCGGDLRLSVYRKVEEGANERRLLGVRGIAGRLSLHMH